MSGKPPRVHADASDESLLDVRNLTTWFNSAAGPVRAVTEVSLDVRPGEFFALVGESGSGKSALARSLLRLHPPRMLARHTGEVRFEGRDLESLDESAMQEVRGRRIGLVLQDPTSALNPVLTIETQIGLVLRRHTTLGRRERRARIVEALDGVGIPDAARRMGDYPGQLSGGMRQRVVIAAALICDPVLLIADEPTTALDVTIQASILQLIDDLRRQLRLGVLFITHDLGVVAEHADRVAVMYAGRIVERGTVEGVFANPVMPYTRALLDSVPQRALAAGHRHLASIPGRPPGLTGPEATACAFLPRCPDAIGVCAHRRPVLTEVIDGREAACHLAFAEREPNAS
ncbi:MAG TPA: ABC transporter ATP-binding protein [Ilumatobacter sp.]|nr:ABC transporter ATP-binding protein [Ilumatobacter sp.]